MDDIEVKSSTNQRPSLFVTVDGRQVPSRLISLLDVLTERQGIVIEAPDSYEGTLLV